MFKELETVILTHDIEAYGLKKGTMGAVVGVHGEGEAYEVEFVDSSTGRTIALLTLKSGDIRSAAENNLLLTHIDMSNIPYTAVGTEFSTNLNHITGPFVVGTAMVVLNTESNRNESTAETERISYLTE